MTYLLLCAVLLVIALMVRIIAEVVARRRGEPIPILPTVLAAVVLVVLTAIFDNVMIQSGLFAYSDAHITGVRIGLAPIEDFSYPIAAAIALPGIWELARRREPRADA